ncbi:terpenoid synthase [Ramaria rubella]|nr:terpenoid synthase [Ramaria rubella]
MAEKYENLLQRLPSISAWQSEKETALLEPFTYITATSGKEIRKKMIEAFNVWLNVPNETVAVIATIVSMLHSASLMMDDVEDDSQLRRGQPVAHKIYGIPQTINTANYVYFLAYQKIFTLRDEGSGTLQHEHQLERLITEEMLNLHRGQGLDLFWRDSLICPTEDEYVQMVNNKTGGLFRIAIKLMMAKSTSQVYAFLLSLLIVYLQLVDRDYVPLVNLISIFFQIRDDYMNLQSSEYESHKGFAEDLTEGKFSFPVVHAVRADTSNRQVLNVLQKRPSTPTTKQYIVDYMRDHTRSFDYTLEILAILERQVRSEIERLGGNEQLLAILDSLSVSNLND